MKPPVLPASPLKSALEEIDLLRHLFRSTLQAYAAGVEGEIATIRAGVEQQAKFKKVKAAAARDSRDMVTLVRTLEIKPEKGRRRDLKKIESVVEDLRKIAKGWE